MRTQHPGFFGVSSAVCLIHTKSKSMKTKIYRKGIPFASLLLGGWMMGMSPLAA
jgi:hypothetical protein